MNLGIEGIKKLVTSVEEHCIWVEVPSKEDMDYIQERMLA